MADEIRPATTCKGCGRAVYVTDIDNDKMCVFCALPKPVALPEADKEDKQ